MNARKGILPSSFFKAFFVKIAIFDVRIIRKKIETKMGIEDKKRNNILLN